MTRSKVKSVQANGTWNGKDGTLFYRYDYEMMDGEELQASHKTEMPFKPGDEVDYEITKTHPTYGSTGKVKKPSDFVRGQNQQSNVNWEEREKKIAIGHAINNAVHLYCNQYPGSQPNRDDIKKYAKSIYEISKELNQEL